MLLFHILTDFDRILTNHKSPPQSSSVREAVKRTQRTTSEKNSDEGLINTYDIRKLNGCPQNYLTCSCCIAKIFLHKLVRISD